MKIPHCINRSKLDGLRHERRLDFAYTLGRVQWDFFATLTFRSPVPRCSVAHGMAWRFLREVAAITSTPYSSLLIALRGEEGEKNGRFHFHVLIGGSSTRNIITDCHRLEHLWRTISGNSISQVRPYDRTLGGASYISKCLGANDYELSKYNLANTVTLSHSVLSVIRSMDAKGERRHAEHMRKDRAVSRLRGLTGVHAESRLYDETPPAVPQV